MNPRSEHILIDAWGIDFKILDDLEYIEKVAVKIANETGATIVGKAHYRYLPQGISLVVLVKESHISLHTYPEEGYLAVDIFTCGNTKPKRAIPVIKESFNPSKIHILEIIRGKDQPWEAIEEIE